MRLIVFVSLALLSYLSSCAGFQHGRVKGLQRLSGLRSHQRNGLSTRSSQLQMAVYSVEQGVPAQLVEERDACGVGFIASRQNEASHSIISQAVRALNCMEHRGASSADNISGDGAGMMSNIPWGMFKKDFDVDAQKNADGSRACAVGMMFLPRDEELRTKSMASINELAAASGLEVAHWREVPVDSSVLGTLSADFVPNVKQAFFVPKAGTDGFATQDAMEESLYSLRRNIQGFFRSVNTQEGYTCSLSTKTIVYKGMLRSCDLSGFFLDLKDPSYEAAFAIYHRRFSTNTVPKWFLAQPMRMLAHNGEINTLLGNINWVRSQQSAAHMGGDSRGASPLVDTGRSDSANLDSVFENFVKSGRSPQEALMMLVPEAYANNPKIRSPDVLDFYEYYEPLQEAWDGPALLVFSDGEVVGATLDRNGLRPARYMVTADKEGKETVHVMSEVGVTKTLAQFDETGGEDTGEVLVDSGRLGPGEMLSLEMKTGKFLLNDELKKSIASKRPYKEWNAKSVEKLAKQPFKGEIDRFADLYVSSEEEKAAAKAVTPAETGPISAELDVQNFVEAQTFYGWGTEDVELQISAMAADGVEATFSMGDDAPLAALSASPHTLYDYFKQRFAQVTNPPIDPLREGAVMSLAMFLGPRGDPLSMDGQTDTRVKIDSPVMNGNELEALGKTKGVSMKTISTLYPVKQALTQGGLAEQIDVICGEVVDAVKAGATVINLSDKGVSVGNTYVSPLLAIGAVHHRLIKEGLRTKASLIVETGQAWSTHHFACLVGYGASAVVPYAAYDAVINWHGQKRNQNAMAKGDLPKLSLEQSLANYRKALDKGLLKILSKMGISLLSSYHGAQIFEAMGLADDVVMRGFYGTPCRVSGLNFDEIAAETADFARRAFGDAMFEGMVDKVESEPVAEGKAKKLFNYGFLNFFKTGEYHHNNQPLVKTLHSALRTHDVDLYKMYEESVVSRPPTTLRDVLEFVPNGESIPLEEVESAESIMKRFCSGGMSLGALSREAHETLAIAMNRIGGKSNSGEGGEDKARFNPIEDVDGDGVSTSFPHLKGLKKSDLATSKIKQIASGRFGVTPEYLMSGQQLEIKMGQGAKPGEGGQLPGKKIDSYIAGLRNSKPGVTLISPPPHHDIYSIEDLAQLIYDLHQINPKAGVSVKLVSEVGIGTVASGVAKAGADVIQISGHDGGTGASPVSSIKHAGSPWELGLIEAHSTLRRNGLRDRVTLRVDGGLKSGWDVVMAAAMGAEEYGFGTIAMIAEGCIMARICHTNKCPVGVTTQNEELRKRFPGTPDNIVTFFGYVADEVRHILATLGYKSMDELIGKAGSIKQRDVPLKKTKNVDTSFLLENLFCDPVAGENFCDVEEDRSWLNHGEQNNNGYTFCDSILDDPEVQNAIETSGSVNKKMKITNVDRTAFARVSGVLAKKYGDNNFRGQLRFDLTGAAGQSFCAFLSEGMSVALTGYANDYVGKGMAGGKVSIAPPTVDDDACRATGRCSPRSQPRFNVAGNTLLYGATGGKLFLRGKAGERFGVRNSGCRAVVEGTGDHCCEYMTAGTVLCLGRTGRNFGAGMTGGVAFVLPDEDYMDGLDGEKDGSADGNWGTNEDDYATFPELLNPDVKGCLQSLDTSNLNAMKFLKESLEEHAEETGSSRAKNLLATWPACLSRFQVIVPASEVSNPLLIKEDVLVGSMTTANNTKV